MQTRTGSQKWLTGIVWSSGGGIATRVKMVGSCAQADLLAVSLVGLVGSVICWRGELPVYSCFRLCV